MTRATLLGVIAMATLVITPWVGASKSLALESSQVGAESLNGRKGLFDDIFGNDRRSDRDYNRRDDWDNERYNDRYRHHDDEDHYRDRYDDDFDFRDNSRRERIQRIYRQGGARNPYGEGDPRGGGHYDWR